MKGKTGKSAMRGGGMARKGVGAALKGGGMARKGTGSKATPGGKKLADGGISGKFAPPSMGGMANPPSDTPNSGPKGSLAGYAAQNYGGPRGPRVPGNPRGTPGMVRPGFPSGPRPGVTPKPGMSGGKGGPGSGQTMPQDIRGAANALGGLPMARKNGGKVKAKKKNGK